MNSCDLNSFGDWELQRQLGIGGFGEVILWQHRLNRQEVATKRLKENNHLSEDEVVKLKERWKKEFNWMLDLKTPFIVRGIELNDQAFVAYLNDHHAWKPLPVIVMEYCNGGDLRWHLKKLENYNGLPEYVVREVMFSMRQAINYLHTECRIEHRDLKPDNIVMHKNGQQRLYKLTDFGFARKCTEDTGLKSVVGTRHYLAPEVLDTAHYTNTVDFWSLGIIAFELMTGCQPFIPHQTPYQIIVNIKKKPSTCIAITEKPEEPPNRYEYHSELFAENRMSKVFRQRMEKWLQLALDQNYKTRGTVLPAPGEKATAAGGRVLKFYTELDAILETKVLTIFCLNTYQFYSFEVSPELSMSEFICTLERDTQISGQNIFLIFPTSHPGGRLTPRTRPIDIFVEHWEDTCGNQPVMLYVLGYQCGYTTTSPYISPIIKKCTQLDAKEPIAEWLLQRFEQQTHFLLNNEQRHLEALTRGLKEYALTVEDEMLPYSSQLQTLQQDIGQLRGFATMFSTMVQRGKEVAQTWLPSNEAHFEEWLIQAAAFNEEVQKVDLNIGQLLKTRYSSALRRIKEEATSCKFDEWCRNDIYGLSNYHRKLQTHRPGINTKARLEYCQEAVYDCIKKRNSFLTDPQLKKSKDTIAEVHQEFRKISEIVRHTRRYLTNQEGSISQGTHAFLVSLFKLRHSSGNNISQKTGLPVEITNGGLDASLEQLLNMNTDKLIEDALKNTELLSMEVNGPTIPTVVEFAELRNQNIKD